MRVLWIKIMQLIIISIRVSKLKLKQYNTANFDSTLNRIMGNSKKVRIAKYLR